MLKEEKHLALNNGEQIEKAKKGDL